MTSNAGGVKSKIYKTKIPDENTKDLFAPLSAKEFLKQIEGYVTSENAKDTIIWTKKRFEASLLRYRGPTFIPTLFKRPLVKTIIRREIPHREGVHIKEFRTQYSVVIPMKHPIKPLVQCGFVDKVYLNIQYNFLNDVLLKDLKNSSKVINLDGEVFGEDTFDQLLMRKEPHFYSEKTKEIITTKFDEWDKNKWSKFPEDCSNFSNFQVEFCMILPEVRVSTVFVTCIKCGQFAETLLNDITIQLAKNDLSHNLTQVEVKEGDEDSVRSVIGLPTHGCCTDYNCSFIDGLMGVTPLTSDVSKPSVFVRIKLLYFGDTLFTEAVHNNK